MTEFLQQGLFDRPLPSQPRPPDEETHAANLNRVRSRIGAAVTAFIRERIASGRLEFRIAELHDYVTEQCGGAPASPDRILRDGRQRGWFDYTVLSRRKSLYKIIDRIGTGAGV